MSLTVDQIAPFADGRDVAQLRKADRSSWSVGPAGEVVGASRRGFLKGTLVLGVVAGLWMLDLWRFPRIAGADGYDMAYPPQTYGCNGISGGYDPCVGCWPSPRCDHCCASQGATAWHRNDLANHYSLRPNQCAPAGTPTSFDGWWWSDAAGACGCSGNSYKKYKCHDGKYDGGGGYLNTICPQPRGCRNYGAWPY